MLNVTANAVGDVATLRLEGDIDEDGANALRVALVKCLRDKQHNVVVNMTGVKFISYMGVGILVERLRQFRANEGDMKLVGLNLYTQRLFRMVGVTTLFETFESESQAIQRYRRAA